MFLNSCSVLIGQVKPVEEKAKFGGGQESGSMDPTWKALKTQSGAQSSTDIPDAAWQSPKTSAVISINSVCRHGFDEDEGNPQKVTELILSQWDNLKVESKRNITVAGYEALETTAKGKYMGRMRKFQTTIVKTPSCIFDLVFLSPVSTFTQELSVFQKFRDTLKLR